MVVAWFVRRTRLKNAYSHLAPNYLPCYPFQSYLTSLLRDDRILRLPAPQHKHSINYCLLRLT